MSLPRVTDVAVLSRDLAYARDRLDPDEEWAPISALEPCEVCGVPVLAVERGERRMVSELESVVPPRVEGRAYTLRIRGHRCQRS